MRRTRVWAAAVVTVVLGASTLPAHGVVRDGGTADVVLDGRAVVEDVTSTWTGVAIEVTPQLRRELGLTRRLPDHVVATEWADQVTSGLSATEKALLVAGGRGSGLDVLVDARTGRYLSVTEAGTDAGMQTLALSIGYVPACATAQARSCLDRGPSRLDVAINGTGTTWAAFSSSQRFSVRRGGPASFTVTYSGGGSTRQSWPAASSVSWSAPGVTVGRITH